MADANSPPVTLKRGLKNRHIQLIALGGAIGTGLFLGSAGVLKSAGPSMILGYAIAGFIAFLIMRQLGEMIVEEPVAGSFSHFAHKYWGGYAGFLSGWNYWVLYVLVGMAELTAVGKYIQFWWPEVPTWVSAVVFFVLVNLINTLNVKVFGEMEFWFAIIKVVAICALVCTGLYMVTTAFQSPTGNWPRRSPGGGVKKTRAAVPLSTPTHSMATCLPSVASTLRTSSAGGSTPLSSFSTLSTEGLSKFSNSSWNDTVAPVIPIRARTSPAVMPKNQCS